MDDNLLTLRKAMQLIKLIILFTASLISATVWAGSPVFTVGDPLDLDCDFDTVADALNSVELVKDIRISNQLVISDGIDLTDKSVAFLRGGFNNCADASNNVLPQNPTYTAVINEQDYGIQLSVFTANSPSNNNQSNSILGLSYDLEISGFEILNSVGGIEISNFDDNSALSINLQQLDIHDNSRNGINFSGNQVVANLNNIQIHNNSNIVGGSTQGGGIRCFNSELNFGAQTAIYSNTADRGGGIYAINCQIEIIAGESFGASLIDSGIYANTANDFGGAMYLSNSQFDGLGQYDHALNISNNTALSDAFLGYGGAIYYNSGSVINLINTLIENNQASYRGSAIAGQHFDANLSAPILTMGRSQLGCSYNSICSSISHNEILATTGIAATVYLRDGARAEINQTLIANNQATTNSGFYLSGDQSRVSMEGNLIYGNKPPTDGDVAETLFKLTGFSSAGLSFNTIADNSVSTLFDLSFDNNDTQSLEIYNSIISNTGSQIIDHNSNDTSHHDANIDCSLLHDLSTGGIEGNGTQVGDPLFFSETDFQLQEYSPAINPLCSNVITADLPDLYGISREQDGIADLGAYESTINDSIIFA